MTVTQLTTWHMLTISSKTKLLATTRWLQTVKVHCKSVKWRHITANTLSCNLPFSVIHIETYTVSQSQCCFTHHRSITRRSPSQSLDWFKTPSLLNQSLGWYWQNWIELQKHRNLNNRLLTHVQTKPNEIKVWFRSLFTPSSQEIDWAYSTAPGASTDPVHKNTSIKQSWCTWASLNMRSPANTENRTTITLKIRLRRSSATYILLWF